MSWKPTFSWSLVMVKIDIDETYRRMVEKFGIQSTIAIAHKTIQSQQDIRTFFSFSFCSSANKTIADVILNKAQKAEKGKQKEEVSILTFSIKTKSSKAIIAGPK